MTVQIKLSPFHRPKELGDYVESQYDWPNGTFVQAGFKGLVVSSDPNKPSYTTSFVEAFPNETFIRGEGETLEEAEKAAWHKYLEHSACPGHEWESRGYQNGGGFCKHCNKFGSKVFTGEQLGQYCNYCGVGTTYGETVLQYSEGELVEDWVCENHYKTALVFRYTHLKRKDEDSLSAKEASEIRHIEFMLRIDDEPDMENIDEEIKAVLNALAKNPDEKDGS